MPGLYRARVLARPQLDADAICAAAQGEAGSHDFGGDWFRKPLSVLLDALRQEARLNWLGSFGAAGQLKKVLKDRLVAEQLFSDNPEIERRALRSPVIVVGPMRSGTTRLHRLLAADSRFAHMRSFETVWPVPPAGFRPGGRDRRWIPAEMILRTVHAFNPTTAIIHPTGPFEPEEELGLLVRSIWGMKHEAQWHVPTFGRWSETQDATPAYRYMARLLKLVGWARGEDDSRPWVLKTPQHMLDLPALLRVFPDARLIFTHREPDAVVGSSCSLVWNQMIIHSDEVCAHGIGREWLRKTELQIERMRKARTRIPESRRIDVRYEEMERDWQGVMRRIYRFLDMEIEPALPLMSNYMADAGRELHRHPHRYSLGAFGLNDQEVRDRFQCYSDEFELRRADLSKAAREELIVLGRAAGRRYAARSGEWEKAAPARAAAGAPS